MTSVIKPKYRIDDTGAPTLLHLEDGEFAVNVMSKTLYQRVGLLIYEIANWVDPPEAGTWTPTLANVANVASSSANTCHYLRSKNEVSFAGTLSVTPSGSGSTQLSITLPIASTLGSTTDDASGVATTQQAITNGAFIRSNGAGKLLLSFTASGGSLVAFRFSGFYVIN